MQDDVSYASENTLDAFTQYIGSSSDALFKLFDTPYKRKKFYEDQLGFIKPEQVLLKTSIIPPDDSSDEMTTRSSFGYYIPFEKCLSNTLKNIPETINLSVNRNDSNLKQDIFNGNYVKKILKSNSDKLVLAIYCDELEFTNAVGSSRTKHKLST